jgi:hypothetical protein
MTCRLEPRVLVLPALLVCLLASCVHVMHPSGVSPGWFAEAGLGRAHESYEERGATPEDRPASGETWDLQVNIGRGWRFSRNSGVLVELLVPLSAHDASVVGALAATSLDLYYQFLGWPVDAGCGAVVGINGGIYLECGRTFDVRGGRQMDVGLGVMAIGGYDVGVPTTGGPLREFALAGVRNRTWRVGLWGTHEHYDEALGRCDEDCQYDDFLTDRWTIGLVLGRRLR